MELEEENQFIRSFISQAYSVVRVACADKEEMVGKLSRVESHSRQVEDELDSLISLVDSLRKDLVNFLEEFGHCRHEVEANGQEYDDLAVCLDQMKVKNEDLKRLKANYAAYLLTFEEGCQEANTRLSVVEGKKVKAE